MTGRTVLALAWLLGAPLTAEAAGSFRILTTALERAGFAARFGELGPVTLLAPADAAFGRLPAGARKGLLAAERRDELTRILADHVVVGRLDGAQLLLAREVKTLSGRRLPVRLVDGRLTVGGATVRAVDRERFGVTVHVLSEVIMPEAEEPGFEFVREAPLPEGFPGPGPLSKVVRKEYPHYRLARAAGASAFWTLFRHIKRNEVRMTAPVEMTMEDRGDALRQTEMAFLYERPEQGKAGADGAVRVLDAKPVTVLSFGLRGPVSGARIREARAAVERRLAAEPGLVAAGGWRLLGYNSPMIPAAKRFWELQLPVRAVGPGASQVR